MPRSVKELVSASEQEITKNGRGMGDKEGGGMLGGILE